ncbi:Ubiquitin-like-specific protease 2 [Neolecta irregularis DAH-3]|uniref:Ubiquitin-like-specific protease 2 n=1 Tax=Neolecta irregularis (strain DAH-3) TaxID=1198029 RepID=A0A1U7LGK2_NEOID|nr:Ubiquitin-like-specific protease 2 [Neolecta irregularis DAH-3]|eukprot:OLL21786.1 Ubiquitin-like-specific protease 2 [Neolecta irregularis DAH-3]
MMGHGQEITSCKDPDKEDQVIMVPVLNDSNTHLKRSLSLLPPPASFHRRLAMSDAQPIHDRHFETVQEQNKKKRLTRKSFGGGSYGPVNNWNGQKNLGLLGDKARHSMSAMNKEGLTSRQPAGRSRNEFSLKNDARASPSRLRKNSIEEESAPPVALQTSEKSPLTIKVHPNPALVGLANMLVNRESVKPRKKTDVSDNNSPSLNRLVHHFQRSSINEEGNHKGEISVRIEKFQCKAMYYWKRQGTSLVIGNDHLVLNLKNLPLELLCVTMDECSSISYSPKETFLKCDLRARRSALPGPGKTIFYFFNPDDTENVVAAFQNINFKIPIRNLDEYQHRVALETCKNTYITGMKEDLSLLPTLPQSQKPGNAATNTPLPTFRKTSSSRERAEVISRANVASKYFQTATRKISTDLKDELKPDYKRTLITDESKKKERKPVLKLYNSRRKKALKQTERTERVPKRQLSLSVPIATFPKEGKDSITIMSDDLERLDEGEFLNDTIIDFYLKLLLQNAQSQEPPRSIDPTGREFYCFNTFFYKRLTQRDKEGKKVGHANVRKWTKKGNVDLFATKYIVVPVNESLHWYLAIICNMDTAARYTLEKFDCKSLEEKAPEKADDTTSLSNCFTPTKAPSVPDEDKIDIDIITDRAADVIPAASGFEQMKKIGEMDNESDGDRENRNATPMENHEIIRSDIGVYNQSLAASIRAVNLNENTTDNSKSGNESSQLEIPPEFDITFSPKNDNPISKKRSQSSMIKELNPGTASKSKIYGIRDVSALEKRGMTIDPEVIAGYHAKVPGQNNFCDCGVYLLHYVEKFLKRPEECIQELLAHQDKKNAERNHESWEIHEIEMKRESIRAMIESLGNQETNSDSNPRDRKKPKQSLAESSEEDNSDVQIQEFSQASPQQVDKLPKVSMKEKGNLEDPVTQPEIPSWPVSPTSSPQNFSPILAEQVPPASRSKANIESPILVHEISSDDELTKAGHRTLKKKRIQKPSHLQNQSMLSSKASQSEVKNKRSNSSI